MTTDCRMPIDATYWIDENVYRALTSLKPRTCSDDNPCDAHKDQTTRMSELSEAATRDRADTAFLVGCAHGRAMGVADVLALRSELADYLDQWQASFGFGDRPLPDHWGIKQRIDALRAIAATEETT